MNYLTEDQLAEFDELGYLVFEGLFDSQLNQRIKDDVDLLMIDRAAGKHKPIISYDELGALTSEPCVVDRVADLMADQKFAHHHIHARWQSEGEPGIVWHHDYEQIPQTNRSHLMVHVFMYLDGLNGEIGDLLVLPGSHRMVIDRRAPQLFKFADLPESLTIDSLAPGSAIILHSAIVHARRPKPGGANFRRYFIDTSYCQNGILWPGYQGIERINRIALEKGFDRDGKYAFLYDSEQFFPVKETFEALSRVNEGSLALKVMQ